MSYSVGPLNAKKILFVAMLDVTDDWYSMDMTNSLYRETGTMRRLL